jgi:glucose-1-phosphate thymidylyltransferase
LLGRGFAWLDTGTHESLADAGQYISTIEKRQGYKVACIEEIAHYKGWITGEQLIELAEPLKKTEYGQYMIDMAMPESNINMGYKCVDIKRKLRD